MSIDEIKDAKYAAAALKFVPLDLAPISAGVPTSSYL